MFTAPPSFMLETWSLGVEESRGSQLLRGESWKSLPPGVDLPYLPAGAQKWVGWGHRALTRMMETELPRRLAPTYRQPTSVSLALEERQPWTRALVCIFTAFSSCICIFKNSIAE